MTFPIDVEDDGTPRAALDVAGQAVRAFNHRSGPRFSGYRNGWNHVPDVYRCLGELTYLTGGLRQVIDYMSEAMQAQLEAGHVATDDGSTYEGRPEQAVAAARAALAAASTSADNLYRASIRRSRPSTRSTTPAPASTVPMRTEDMPPSLRDREVYRCIDCGETVPASQLTQHRRTHYTRGDGPPGFDIVLSAEQVAADDGPAGDGPTGDGPAGDVGDDTIVGA